MTRAHNESRAHVAAQVGTRVTDEFPTPPPCTTDPEMFFPRGEGDWNAPQIAAAKAVCATCPIVAACLAHSLAHRIEFGVWGGVDQKERRSILRQQGRKNRKVPAAKTSAAAQPRAGISERITAAPKASRAGQRLNGTKPRNAREVAADERLRAAAEVERVRAVETYADTAETRVQRLHAAMFDAAVGVSA